MEAAELGRFTLSWVRTVGANGFDTRGHRPYQRGQQFSRRIADEQPNEVIFHLRKCVGEIHPIGVLTVLVEAIRDRLGDPSEECGQVECKDFGVEILLHELGTQAGEILDFEPTFLLFVAFFHTPAQVVEVLEPGCWVGLLIKERGGEDLGLAAFERYADQAQGDRFTGQAVAPALLTGFWTRREPHHLAAFPTVQEIGDLVRKIQRHAGTEVALLLVM